MGEVVDIQLTQKTVETYFYGSKMSSYARYPVQLRDPIAKQEHMAPERQKYLAFNSEEFLVWAMSIGQRSTGGVKRFLSSGKEPDQAYKSCASLSKLAERYRNDRLENACDRVLNYSHSPTICIISTILKNGQDRLNKEPQQTSSSSSYGITRGAAYYRKNSDLE